MKIALKEQLTRLKAGFKLRKVDPVLAEIVLKDLETKLAEDEYFEEPCAYIGRFLEALINWCRQPQAEREKENLGDRLLCLGFNSILFTEHYREQIGKETEALYNTEEKFDRLCWYEKKFSILIPRNSGVFCPDGIRSIDLLLDYIRAELWYLQQKQNYGLVASLSGSIGSAPGGSGYRIRVSVSADVLIYLVRLLVESGVIMTSPRKKLLGMVATNFQTIGIGNSILSVNSLEKKYEQVVQSTAIALRAVLIRMLKILDHRFNLG